MPTCIVLGISVSFTKATIEVVLSAVRFELRAGRSHGIAGPFVKVVIISVVEALLNHSVLLVAIR